MEQIIRIDGINYTAKATALSLIIYRANFGRDGLRDILDLFSTDAQTPDTVDASIILRLLWTFVKTAEASTLPYNVWLHKFCISELNIATEALPQVVELLNANMQMHIISNAVSGSSSKEPLTTELFMRRAIDRGLLVSDFNNMTIGMVLDYLILCQNVDLAARANKPEEATRAATQADIDAF